MTGMLCLPPPHTVTQLPIISIVIQGQESKYLITNSEGFGSQLFSVVLPPYHCSTYMLKAKNVEAFKSINVICSNTKGSYYLTRIIQLLIESLVTSRSKLLQGSYQPIQHTDIVGGVFFLKNSTSEIA